MMMMMMMMGAMRRCARAAVTSRLVWRAGAGEGNGFGGAVCAGWAGTGVCSGGGGGGGGAVRWVSTTNPRSAPGIGPTAVPVEESLKESSREVLEELYQQLMAAAVGAEDGVKAGDDRPVESLSRDYLIGAIKEQVELQELQMVTFPEVLEMHEDDIRLELLNRGQPGDPQDSFTDLQAKLTELLYEEHSARIEEYDDADDDDGSDGQDKADAVGAVAGTDWDADGADDWEWLPPDRGSRPYHHHDGAVLSHPSEPSGNPVSIWGTPGPRSPDLTHSGAADIPIIVGEPLTGREIEMGLRAHGGYDIEFVGTHDRLGDVRTMVFVTGRNGQHLRRMADMLWYVQKHRKLPVAGARSVEMYDSHFWMICDCGEHAVFLMIEEAREALRLERRWKDQDFAVNYLAGASGDPGDGVSPSPTLRVKRSTHWRQLRQDELRRMEELAERFPVPDAYSKLLQEADARQMQRRKAAKKRKSKYKQLSTEANKFL